MAELGIVENTLLCLVPNGHRSLAASNDDLTTVPAVWLRDIPSFLGRRSLCSWTNLSDRTPSVYSSEPSIRIEERNVRDLLNLKPLRHEHGSFYIPNGSVQIYATGDEGAHLMIQQKSRLRISKTCGYIAGDFCGVGGYQQVIWLPRLILVDLLQVWNLDSAKHVLVEMLRQSILTDGININMSNDAIVGRVSDPMGGSCPSIALHEITKLPTDHQPTAPVEESPIHSHRSTQRSGWATTMARALETQLLRERMERDRRMEEQELQQHLVAQNRMALKELTNPEGNGIEAVRVRYHVLPSSGAQSTSVFLEVDVSPTKATHENPTLYGLHLSCTPVSSRNPSVTVQTHSGIVPELQYETCVTVTAIAEVKGIMFTEDAEDDWVCCLSIEAHWKCTLHNEGRRADKVADLCLSLESLLLVQQKMKLITLIPSGRKPSAVYECRKPHIVRVEDVSRCAVDWNVWVASLNDALQGTGSRIDVSHHQGEIISTVSIVVFAFPAEDLPGLVALVKRRLPDLAVIL